MAEDTQSLPQQILEIGPLMMRSLSAELRQGERVQDSAHFRLMWMLEHRSASLSELAERQMVSLPTMSNSITFLEQHGWVTRTRSSEDRRRVVIEMTPAGHEALAYVRQRMEAKVAEIIGALTPEQQADVTRGLAILRQAFIAAHQRGWCEHSHE